MESMMWSTRAENLAAEAHAGQVDKSGQAYIHHARRVAARVRSSRTYTNSNSVVQDALVALAWVHDVVEDTSWTVEEVTYTVTGSVEGTWSEAFSTALDALTHRKNEPRMEYYTRIKSHPWAVAVKTADIADNTSPERLALLDEDTQVRLRGKYYDAMIALSAPGEGARDTEHARDTARA